MKNSLLISILVFISGILGAQSIVNITTDITTNTTWTNNNIYVLKDVSFIYVLNNATLTIEPGTIVRGAPAGLVITRGSKLIAEGTEEQPIVFTSNEAAGNRNAGDWGGISLLGYAKVNCPGGECLLEGGIDPAYGKYGGSDDADNSGSLKYVRIEYAGIAFQPNNETNGLTMGGVGSGTIIEHVQSTFGGDDAFEWFGGMVNGKYLVAYKTVDDIFDTDFGFGGNVQFALGISDPNIADISGSNGFESDNDATGTINEPITNATFSNVTLLGPKTEDPTATINNNFKRAMHIRRSSRQDIMNSVLVGFPTGLRLESANSENAFLTDGTLNLRSNVLAGMVTNFDSVTTNYKVVVDSFTKKNTFLTIDELKLNSKSHTNPQPWPATGSPLLTGANFTGASSFFQKVAYKGAFGTDNWTKCWCEFDPDNANYDVAPINYTAGINDFTYTVDKNTINLTSNTNAPNLTLKWTIGTVGSVLYSATTANTSFTLPVSGTYTVILTITNQRGCIKTYTQKVDIVFAANEVVISNDITSNTTWTNNNIYVLNNVSFIYVRNNATLTIEKGTIIKGNPAGLVITRGSKLIAIGTETQPIVFTSGKAPGQRAGGDWGGISLLGNAKVNCPGGECLLEGGIDPLYGKYGGTDDADNSGILQYVRIEFAGIAFQPNNETNGLTMGGVGTGTTINHVQSSYGGDDAFEWFGGNVDGKYLVAFKTVDDIFDTDFGFSGRIQYALGVSDPNIADISGSNGFESDNDATGTTNVPNTNATFSNVTLVGPKADPNTTINPNFTRAMHIRRSSLQDVVNSVLIGFPTGLRLESANSQNAFLTGGTLNLRNNVVAGMNKNIDSVSTNFGSIATKFNSQNEYKTLSELQVKSLSHVSPEPIPLANSSLLSGASFTGMDPFFEQVNYRGAFGTTNWTKCWCEFDPINADYTSSPLQYFADPGEFTFIVNGKKSTFTAPQLPNAIYHWDFGVPNNNIDTSNLANPVYNYPINGDYTVTLTITNIRGCQITKTNIVKIDAVATTQIESVQSINIYPNPVSDNLTLDLNASESFFAGIRIISSNGKVVKQTDNQFTSGNNKLELNVSELASGYYMINLYTAKGIQSIGFIKSK